MAGASRSLLGKDSEVGARPELIHFFRTALVGRYQLLKW